MALLRDLIRRPRQSAERETARVEHPLFALQRDLNRAFENLWSGTLLADSDFGGAFDSMVGFTPKIEVRDTDDRYIVMAELPGMDENDISVSLTGNALTISGEKKQEIEEEKEGVYHSEIRYGRFSRTIPVPEEIDADKVSAKFKKGVLTVEMPKTIEARESVRKIAVKTDG